MALHRFALLACAATLAGAECPALCTATTDNTAWPCRYHSSGCQVTVAANPVRTSVDDINVAVISPYSGGLGDLMTMVEPAIAAATQDVENSALLSGYRLNVYLGDSKCTVPDATQATIEACTSGPTKHVIFADSCSASCEAVNDAARYFNVLQVGPGCVSTSLSDSSRYPYFTRLAPSFRFNVLAVYEFMMLMSFRRIGIVYGYRSINILAMDLLVELVQEDLDAGRYNWTVLFKLQITSEGNLPDAQSATVEMRRKDSRINFLALYQNEGSMLLCQSYHSNMLSPDYNFFVASGWWNPGFIMERAGASDCPCSVAELHRAAVGAIAADRGPMLNTDDVHGMSGRRLSDIYSNYTQDCSSFGGGTGICNHQWAGYFYDGIWLIASILNAYMLSGNRSVADLATASSRQALEELSLQVDFMGITGRVRQFNAVSPTTTPPSLGDRDGVILLRQAGGPPEDTFNQLAYRSETGILFQTDVQWSPDAAHRVSCSGTCSLSSAWLPPDRSSSCPDGEVWTNELGCTECPAGQHASGGTASCQPCGMGFFASQPGAASCQQCLPGSYSSATGATACSDCPAGHFRSSAGATDCQKCSEGTYASQPGQVACTLCPPGLTTSFEGALELSVCSCDGFYWEEQCIKCDLSERFDNGVCVSCNRSIICDHGLVIGYAPTDAEWSNTLNMAGKQRTLAQLMTNEFLLAALGIHPQENKEKMEATISLFGATLQNLMFGNSSDQILAAPTNVLEYLQNEVLPVYTSMASLLSQNTGSSPGMSVLYELYEQNMVLFAVSDDVVNLLVEAAETSGAQTSGILVDIAGRQGSMIQKMLKDVLFCALGVSIQSSLESLRSNQKIFEDSHSAIIEGAEFASIPKLTRLCTMHQMRLVTYYYEAIRGPVRMMLSAEIADAMAVAVSAANNMSALTEPLAEAMNVAVELYASDPGTCTPREHMTHSDWWSLMRTMSSLQIQSQKVYRLYMQVASGSLVEQGKVDLAVETPATSRLLNHLIQGSKSNGIPAPPTQDLLSRLLSLGVVKESLLSILEESIALDHLPASDVGRVEYLTNDMRDVVSSLVNHLLAEASVDVSADVPVGLLAVISDQKSSVHRLAAEAYEVARGIHVEKVVVEINKTIKNFHSVQKDLLLGSANSTRGLALRRVSNVCAVHQMRLVENAYGSLEIPVLSVVGGQHSELDSLRGRAEETLDLMLVAADFLITYYEGGNVTCPQHNLTSEEFQDLMLEASEICVLTNQAFSFFVRGDFPDSLEEKLADATKSFEKLMLGYLHPHLPAPPTQTCYNFALQVESAVNDFRDVMDSIEPSSTVAANKVADVCEAARALAGRYADEAEAAYPEWPRARVELLNWQRALAAQTMAAAVAASGGGLAQAIEEFEGMHLVLRDGSQDGAVSEIIPERDDLKEHWKQIDAAWGIFKTETQSQNIEAMLQSLTDLELKLLLALPAFGIVDNPTPPNSPWVFVATYAAMTTMLCLCGHPDERANADIQTDKSTAAWLVNEKHKMRLTIMKTMVSKRRQGLLSLLLELLSEMVNVEVPPDVTLWQHALDFLILMPDMQVPINTVACNSAVYACCGGSWEAALAVLASTSRHGIPCDIIGYSSAIKACSFERKWEQALQLLKSAELAGLALDAKIFRALTQVILA
ncbi:GABBR2 [Symbiodinium sp. KB8]|nr:GABBR2 [Symbiodinium sp. KB8]